MLVLLLIHAATFQPSSDPSTSTLREKIYIYAQVASLLDANPSLDLTTKARNKFHTSTTAATCAT